MEEGKNWAGPPRREVGVLARDNLQPADAGADEDAHAVCDLGCDLEARLDEGFLCRREGEMDEAPHLARFLLVHEIERVEVFDLAAKCYGKPCGVYPSNGPHTTPPRHKFR